MHSTSHFHCLVVLAVGVVLTSGCAAHRLGTTTAEQDARLLFNAGHSEEGLALLEQALRQHPESLRLGNLYRGQIRKQKKEDRSIAFFKTLLKDAQSPDEAYFSLAFAYIDKIPRVGPMGAGFLSKRSIAMFREVLKRNPDNWIANYGIGMNYLHWPAYFKKNESAVGYFEKCVKLQRNSHLKPYHLLTYVRLGDAHAKNGDVENARKVWQMGLELFPGHKDLRDRILLDPKDIPKVISEYYNPNHSIGVIDTDVSVLWATEVPSLAVPLRREASKAAVDALRTRVTTDLSEGQLGLFSWFVRNLPFLTDKRFYSRVDMSPLGIQKTQSERPLANEIAHGMILGFVSVMEDIHDGHIAEETEAMDGFLRPFYHEGLGMGLAADLDTGNSESFKQFLDKIEQLDSRYARLYLAGAGVWFALEAFASPEDIVGAFDWLGPFGASYAYEGFGFGRALFHLHRNRDALEVGRKLPPLAAQSFYHGAGRAFWILDNQRPELLGARLDLVPQAYRGDAYSGYGMGMSFTKVDDPSWVSKYLGQYGKSSSSVELITGLIMGYTIRNIADKAYMETIVAKTNKHGECWLEAALELGCQALQEVEEGGGDFHANWRFRIRQRVLANPSFIEPGRCR